MNNDLKISILNLEKQTNTWTGELEEWIKKVDVKNEIPVVYFFGVRPPYLTVTGTLTTEHKLNMLFPNKRHKRENRFIYCMLTCCSANFSIKLCNALP